MSLPDDTNWYFDTLKNTVVPNTQRLIAAFRDRASHIAFTEFGSHTADGQDLPPWAAA